MPDKSDHTTLASENLKTLRYICQRIDDFPQWATTIATYAALQAIEALFAHRGIHSDQHGDRNRRLKSDSQFSHIWKHYRPLYNDSLLARYMEDAHSSRTIGPLFSQYMSGEKVMQKHVKHHLHQIIRSVRNITGDDDFLIDVEPMTFE